MIAFDMAELAQRLGGRHIGADVRIDRVAIDSRAIHHGDLFVALVGPNFDGHDFLADARAQGAAGAMVSTPHEIDLPQLAVADTRLGLGRLGALWRSASGARVIALTGSNGKTTLREMLASILRQRGSVLATEGNLNNDIGMPLTLTRLQDEDFAVIEMGANHAGEIDYLSRLARPHVAVINNVARAHLEGFGSLDGVARAKAEIINGLDPAGRFVFNADDAYADLWRELGAAFDCLTFGEQPMADVRALWQDAEVFWTDTGFVNRFRILIEGRELAIALPLGGAHNRRNALAAAAAAYALDCEPSTIVSGLAAVRPVPGRLCPARGPDGVRVIDDTYNANPDSVGAAIEVLAGAPGRRLLVLGDLAELGENRDALHAELGARAKAAAIDRLFTCGRLSRAAADSFGIGALHFEDCDALVDELLDWAEPGDVILVKGSRSAHMERVIAALAGEAAPC